MATRTLYPAIAPSLDLNFAGSKTLDPRITFSRASAATYYDGKTVAKAEENLLLQSSYFAQNWNQGAVVLTSNAGPTPDNTSTASSIVADGTNTQHRFYHATTLSAGLTYVFSVHAKAGSGNFVQLSLPTGLASYANFDLTLGVVGSSGGIVSASISSLGGGWYRCAIVATAVSTIAGSSIICLIGSSSDLYYPANTLNTSIYIWGAQLEQRSQVTAYTPTTTQPITNYIPVLQTALAGVPRFDHNPVTGESLGLLVEEQRTNLLTYSEQLSNSAWVKTGTLNVDAAVSPDGTLSADLLSGSMYRGFSANASTLSFYAKAGGGNTLTYSYDGSSGTVSFNLSTGSVSGTAGGQSGFMTPIGNGWYRCWIYLNVGGVNHYFGAAFGIYIWGAQLEAGAFPSSYIKTEASQVTRAADLAQMTGANFSSWYRQDEGATVSEFVSSTIGIFHVHSNISGYGLEVGISAGNDAFQYNNSTNLVTSGNKYVRGSTGKIGFAGSLTSRSIALNGGSVAASQTPMIMNNTQQGLRLGATASGSLCINGCIKRLTYYPKRLTDAQLQALTA